MATNLAISLRCVCYSFAFLFISYYPMGYGLMFLLYEPISFINSSLRASLAHQPHLSTLLRLLASVPTMPARFTTSFLGPFTSSLPLFTPMGLLLNSLEFLGPFTTSLPPIPLLGLLAFKLAH